LPAPWRLFIEWINSGEGCFREIKKIVRAGATEHQDYMVAVLEGLGKSLIINGKLQSSLADEAWYHEALVHPTLLSHPCPRRVLIIGGGEGATLREVLRHECVEEAVMVDIDKELVDIAIRELSEWHQGSFMDKRARLIFMDGRKYLEEKEASYDAIILDLIDPEGPATLLYTLEFYRLVKRSLQRGGVMVTQATSPVLTPQIFRTIRNTLLKVFRNVVPYITYVRGYNGLWGFIFASDTYSPLSLDSKELGERIRNRIKGSLSFYDAVTHAWMFSLPKPIRDMLDEDKETIATDEKPLTMPS